MKVFVSWSGDLSRRVAESLRETLPCILQRLDVFVSSHDIESGARWTAELAAKLDQSSFGVVCLTPENVDSKWLHFEAGALTKHADGRACCLLLNGLSATDIAPPLSQFQNREFDKKGVHALIRDLNGKLDIPLERDQVDKLFEKFWPDVMAEYSSALSVLPQNKPNNGHRTERELLEEILLRVRTFESNGLTQVSLSVSDDSGDMLSRPINYDSLAWYTASRFPGMAVSDRVQRLLLRDMNPSRYTTLREVDDAITRAREAVEAYAKEKPEWFKFGSDYITKSLGFVDPDFRRKHGFAQRTRDAFSKYDHLVRPAE